MRVSTMLLLVVAVIASSCARDDGSKGNGEAAPVRAAQAPYPVGQVDGLGLEGVKLIVDLSETRTDQWGTVNCHSPLSAGFVIGKATCHEDASLSAEVIADQAFQVCKSGEAPIVEPHTGILVLGCDSGTYDISAYPLAPALTVSLER